MATTVVYQPGMQLGKTFDLKTYTTGMSIFTEGAVSNTTKTERHVNNIKYSVVYGSSDVNNILGVSGDMSLKCKAGILEVEGMGSYLREDRSQENTMEIIARAQVETVTESMKDESPKAGWTKNRTGTHFIRSIVYGGDLIVRIRIKGKSSKEFNDIQAKVKADLKTTGVVDAGAQAKFKKMEDEIRNTSEIDIEYYSTTAKGEMPRDISGMLKALDTFKDEVQQLNEGKGVPCKCEIVPLNMLDDSYPSVLKDSAFSAQMRNLEDKFDDVIIAKSKLDRFLNEDSTDMDLNDEEEETASSLEQRIDDARQSMFQAISEIDVTSQKEAIPKIKDAMKTYKEQTNKKSGGFLREVTQFIKKVSGTQIGDGPDVNIVLLGKTGHGKSSTGNTILGESKFDAHSSGDIVTNTCQTSSRVYDNRTITVMDTPDTDMNKTNALRQEINNFCKKFPRSVFLLVLRWNTRMTGEQEAITKIIDEISFRKDMLSRTLIVFTHGDTFRPDVKSRTERKDLFDTHIGAQIGLLEKLLKKVDYRYILVNNMEQSPRKRLQEAAAIVSEIDALQSNAHIMYVEDRTIDGSEFTTVSSRPPPREQTSTRMYNIAEMHARGWEYEEPGCFPANASVTLDSHVSVPMNAVRVGQTVLTMSPSGTPTFSQIYFFGHSSKHVVTDFVNVSTRHRVIKLSPDHHIFIKRDGMMQTIPARGIKEGMTIMRMSAKSRATFMEDTVTDVSYSTEIGLYAPFTMSGNIIVDGVLASCYVDCVPPRWAHPLLWPVRQVYRVAPSFLGWISETRTDGIPNLIRMMMKIFLNPRSVSL